MPKNSELRLRVRKGSKYSSNPVLLVNLPEPVDGSQEDEEERKVGDTGAIGSIGLKKDDLIDVSKSSSDVIYTMT